MLPYTTLLCNLYPMNMDFKHNHLLSVHNLVSTYTINVTNHKNEVILKHRSNEKKTAIEAMKLLTILFHIKNLFSFPQFYRMFPYTRNHINHVYFTFIFFLGSLSLRPVKYKHLNTYYMHPYFQ